MTYFAPALLFTALAMTKALAMTAYGDSYAVNTLTDLLNTSNDHQVLAAIAKARDRMLAKMNMEQE